MFFVEAKAIRKALMGDGRGLRNPVCFRFIQTVDNRTAERFARMDGRLAGRARAVGTLGPGRGTESASSSGDGELHVIPHK